MACVCLVLLLLLLLLQGKGSVCGQVSLVVVVRVEGLLLEARIITAGTSYPVGNTRTRHHHETWHGQGLLTEEQLES